MMTAVLAEAQSFALAQAHRLSGARAKQNVLAHLTGEHRRWLIRRKARLREVARVWPLGVLLLESDGSLHATGSTVTSQVPTYPGHVSSERERRRHLTQVAFESGFSPGTVVHINTQPLSLSEHLGSVSLPLILKDNELLVGWNSRDPLAHPRPFTDYVLEQVQLLEQRQQRE